MLAVSPAARGRGVGRALVEHCLRRSRELGYAGIRMSSMDRMTSAHRVYERLGFVRAPRGRLVARARASTCSPTARRSSRPSEAQPTRDMNLSASTTTRVTSPEPTSLPSCRAATLNRTSFPSTWTELAVT